MGDVKPSAGLAPLVAMMQAADSRMAEVRSVVVVVRYKLSEKSVQVPLVEDDHVVEQVSPHGLNPAFCHTVLPCPPKTLRPLLVNPRMEVRSGAWATEALDECRPHVVTQ